MKTYEEVDELYYDEYLLHKEAIALNDLETEKNLHLQAFLNQAVQSTKKQGDKTVMVYPTFGDFFDEDERKRQIFGEEVPDRKRRLASLIAEANRTIEEGGDDDNG